MSRGTCALTQARPKEGDGRLTGFLDHPKGWRHLDCELFYKLKKLVHEKKRKVKEVQKSGILRNAVFADKPVDVAEISGSLS